MNQLIIFDFDGVLVNTKYTTFNYYRKILPKYDIHLKEEDFKYKIGRKSIDFFKDVLGHKYNQNLVDKLIKMKRQEFIKNVPKYLEPLKGAFELLENCRKANIQMAIGSQNERELIEKALDIFSIRKYFKMTTSLQDIKNKKPHPEVFLLVAKTLNISPKKTVVIEDSPLGIEAAEIGGFKSIGITTSFLRNDLIKADLIIDSMTKLAPKLLINL